MKGGTSDPSLYHENVINLSLFYRYYFGNCSFELAELVPLPFSGGMSTCYADRSHDISVTISRCDKDVYVNSFFPHTARLWSSLECFSLTNDLNGFKSKINRHLLTARSFYCETSDFFFWLIFLVSSLPSLTTTILFFLAYNNFFLEWLSFSMQPSSK